MALITPFSRNRSSAGAIIIPFVQGDTLALAHFNGADGATSFSDDITNTGTWTRTQTAALTTVGPTAGPKFGTACMNTATINSASFITGTASNPYNTTSLDVTIEAWVAYSSTIQNALVLEAFEVGGNTNIALTISCTAQSISATALNTDNTTAIGAGVLTAAVTISVDTWYHAAIVCRQGAGSADLFFDGNRVASVSGLTFGMNTFDTFRTRHSGTRQAWADEYRASGISRYSGATYTIPSLEFIAD